jgi:replicative DNA helicase
MTTLTGQNKNKNNNKAAVDSLLLARTLPHSIEMERSIIGAITQNPDLIYTVIDILQPEDFYDASHQIIYTAILKIFDKSHSPTLLLVVEELRNMGLLLEVGGPYYITQCQNFFVSDANLEAHCRIVLQKSIKRKTIKLCAETMERMFDEANDVFEILENHNETLFVNTNGILVSHNVTMGAIGKRFLERVDKAWNEGMIGVPTGIPKIDKITKGLQPGTLSILGARTRHGKSALAAAIMNHCTQFKDPNFPAMAQFEYKFPCAYMSIEMPDTEVYGRLVSNQLAEMGYPISYSKFLSGKDDLKEEDLNRINLAVAALSSRAMYIDDSAELNLYTLKSRIMKMVNKFGVKLVIIDYAQLMGNGTENKHTTQADSLAAIAKYCKRLAKLFGIAIILLSQVDRETEKRDPRPPVIADLKGSGGLEESADYIFLCWRPEVWNDNPVNEETQMSDRGIMYVNLVKHKNGRTELARIPFSVADNCYGDMSIVEGFETVNNYYNERPQPFV